MSERFRSLAEKGVYTLSVVREDPRYFYVEIRAMRSGVNRNNWDFTAESIEKNKNTFRGQPILCAYKGSKIGGGHDFDMTYNYRTKQNEPDFRGSGAERIVGMVPMDAEVRIETIDGEKWIVVPGIIFKYYASQLVDYIKECNTLDVSVETIVSEENTETLDNGVERFNDWYGVGITILGKGVAPAIDGAKIRALSESQEFKKMQLKAASYNSDKANKCENFYCNINKLIRKGVI
ncbi:MAG: hypothetical protein AB9836_04520 [Aminipila sp.]